MLRVTVLYPTGSGTRFDLDYYTGKHIPMVQARLGAALKSSEVYVGLPGPGGASAPFAAICHLHFDDVAAFQAAFGPHAREIMSDLPNYTDIAPQTVLEQRKL